MAERIQRTQDFNPDALRDRYRAERDKRLRADGNDQYQNVVGMFEHFIEDPYVEPGFCREPRRDEVEVLIVGGGFGGMLAAARLRETEIDSICIVEKGGDFGGTWYWNRYPGAMCDVESYIYLPLLEEVGYMPKEKYTRAPEILAYSKAFAKKYRFYDNACLQTEVTGMRWDDRVSRWIVTTNRGDSIGARFVCHSNGPLNRPKLPAIPGVEAFRGKAFHTSRWDYQYTGGNAEGNLTGLGGKRVAIIGTGATAVQCVPHVGAAAEHLFVFQRTPSSIDVRNNRPTDAAWAENLSPGWQAARRDNFNILVSGGYQQEDLVSDGWTDIIRSLILGKLEETDVEMAPENVGQFMELADFKKMEQIRARAEDLVQDENTAEALKPWYRQFCKRPCFHDEYLLAFNRPNVTLVDTDGRGVERITECGLVCDGVEYQVDCIIYATGFEVGTGYTRRSGYEIYGRDGQSLTGKWQRGLSTLHGMHSRGFPNSFFMGPPQSAFTVNYPHSLDEQSIHLAYIIKQAQDRGVQVVEAAEEAEQQWVRTIIDKARMNQEFQAQCTPGYYNNEGQLNELAAQGSPYGGGSMEFFALMQQWRDAGELEGLELTSA